MKACFVLALFLLDIASTAQWCWRNLGHLHRDRQHGHRALRAYGHLAPRWRGPDRRQLQNPTGRTAIVPRQRRALRSSYRHVQQCRVP